MTNRVYLCLAHMSGKEMQYIQEAFDTNWVVPLGPNVNGFEIILITVYSRNVIVYVIYKVKTFKASIL